MKKDMPVMTPGLEMDMPSVTPGLEKDLSSVTHRRNCGPSGRLVVGLTAESAAMTVLIIMLLVIVARTCYKQSEFCCENF